MAGLVVSPHPLATAAGQAVLERGGNAAEAAIATGAVLAVVLPHFCGLGGDGVWMLADRDGLQTAILGIGQAPQLLPDLPATLPLRGPGSMLTTACLVDGWDHLLQFGQTHWQGGMSFANLVAPAIEHARVGVPASASQSFWRDFRREEWQGWPGFADIFATDHLHQPQLAEILTLLAEDGPRSFYTGRAGQRVAQGLDAAGSPLAAGDLASTSAREAAPLSLRYRDLTLLAPPWPTQGMTTLQIMGILDRFDIAATTGANRLHLLIEAVKQAFLDRGEIADPDTTPVSDALSSGWLDARAAAIRPEAALPWPHRYQHGDTVFFAVCDGAGRSVSALQSTYFDWGSGVVVGDTGILWQNRGAAFATDAAHPNCIAPGKRPFYTLNPGIALKDGAPHLLYGTQGADGQPQTLARILTALIDDGMSPAEALTEPRFLLGRTFSDSRDSAKIEASMPRDQIEALAALGHELTELPALSPIFGCAGVIRLGAGLTGAHDPRG